MGLISRPEWRRLKRAYDIRKDLEHEDDQYEAGIEDCVYIFRTCIEIVLSRDPITPVRISDIKDIIESPKAVTLSAETLQDFSNAPNTRQLEIKKFLIGISRDGKKPDITRQNAVEALRTLAPVTRRSVQAEVGEFIQELLEGKPIDLVHMKIAAAAAVTAYLKQSKVRSFFEEFNQKLAAIGHHWKSHDQHWKILDDFEDVGGFPQENRTDLITWMVRCYIGEPGGYGMGINRAVFYSNVAAPRIERMFRAAGPTIEKNFEEAASKKEVKAATGDKHVARRLETLRDMVIPGSSNI